MYIHWESSDPLELGEPPDQNLSATDARTHAPGAQAEFGSFWRHISRVVSSKSSERPVERGRNRLPARTHLLSLSRQHVAALRSAPGTKAGKAQALG